MPISPFFVRGKVMPRNQFFRHFLLIYPAFRGRLTIVLHQFEPLRSTIFGTGWWRWAGKQERLLRSEISADFFSFSLDLCRGL
jgi:hypothetical protein